MCQYLSIECTGMFGVKCMPFLPATFVLPVPAGGGSLEAGSGGDHTSVPVLTPRGSCQLVAETSGGERALGCAANTDLYNKEHAAEITYGALCTKSTVDKAVRLAVNVACSAMS